MRTKPISKKHILLTVLFAVYTAEYMLSLISMDQYAYPFAVTGAVLHYLKMPALALGFLLFPLSRRIGSDMRVRRLLFLSSNVIYILGMALVTGLFFSASLTLFVISCLISLFALGFLGGAVYYYVATGFVGHPFFGRLMGIGGAMAFLMQMTAQYLISTNSVLILLLIIGFLFTAYVTLTSGDRFEWMFDEPLEYASEGDPSLPNHRKIALGITVMVLLHLICGITDTALISMNFAGDMTIYAWPRLGGVIGYLIGGFLIDLDHRKWLTVAAFCMTILCMPIPFMLNEGHTHMAAFIYYVIVVGQLGYLNMYFWTLAPMTKLPELWAGMGRITECAVSIILPLFSGISVMTAMVFEAGFAAAVILCIALGDYLPGRDNKTAGASKSSDDISTAEAPVNHLRLFTEQHGITPKEQEILVLLIESDDEIKVIADNMGMTTRTVYRHINSIYEKTGTNSRYSLIRYYYETKAPSAIPLLSALLISDSE